ncbi:MAG: glycosyltransferase family 4 protein [Candidatus Aminicenantes bacterium]|nr:glycosyltransferase family 4 protein [Candidatus Aminicenantes bacterium]
MKLPKLERYKHSKSKIILIGSIPPPHHGANIYFQNLLNSKIKEDFEIFHLDTSDHRNLDNLSKLDFINIYLALKNIIELVWMLIKIKPNLVYIPPATVSFLPYLRDGLFILFVDFFSHAKIITHMHGGNYFRIEFYEKSNSFVRFFIRWTLSKVDTAIVLGKSLKNIFHDFVKNIVVVPNGTDFDPFKNKKFIIQQNNNRIFVSYLGNLFKNKGVLDLIHAAKIVLDKYKNVKFIFAGSWCKQELEIKNQAFKFIHENNLQSNIEFVGVVLNEKKENFLANTDIFVFPSWYEGFPLVILEAMAAGCPIISTKDVGVIPEVVVDNVNGILVEKQKPNQIAGSIIKLIENPRLREEMGRAGRERFEKYYTIEQNINMMIRAFNNTLNEKSKLHVV